MQFVIEDTRASKGVVHDYYTNLNNPSNKYKEPPYLYEVLMDMVFADPVLFRAIDLTVGLVTSKGYDFIGENERDIKRAKKIFDDTLDFDRVIKNTLWQMLVHGDSYLEIRWNGSKTDIKELNPRDTQDMKINYDTHGEIKAFVETVRGKGEAEAITYQPDEMIYFRLYWVGSEVYSKCPFSAIRRGFATKIFANDYLQSIFRNLPPKVIYFLKSANDKQLKDFIENIQRAKTNPNIDIIAQSNDDFESKVSQVKFDEGLIKVLEYLRKEVLMITGVPPHWIGILDGANRGIGENVVIPFETKIKQLQHEIESQVNRELMPKLGLSNVVFKWNAISLMDEKSIIQNMQFLSSIRIDGKTIIDYAREHGLNLRGDAKIEELPMMGGPQTQKDGSLSRQRGNAKTDKMGAGLDKKGVSSEGKAKLEAKKVSA